MEKVGEIIAKVEQAVSQRGSSHHIVRELPSK